MVRVSMGPLRLIKSHNTGKYVLNYYGYVHEEYFRKLDDYQTADYHALDTPGLAEQVQIFKKKALLTTDDMYQFNASEYKNQRGDGYKRMVVFLDNPDYVTRLKKVSWFEAYIEYNFLRIGCKIVNLFTRNK